MTEFAELHMELLDLVDKAVAHDPKAMLVNDDGSRSFASAHYHNSAAIILTKMGANNAIR